MTIQVRGNEGLNQDADCMGVENLIMQLPPLNLSLYNLSHVLSYCDCLLIGYPNSGFISLQTFLHTGTKIITLKC